MTNFWGVAWRLSVQHTLEDNSCANLLTKTGSSSLIKLEILDECPSSLNLMLLSDVCSTLHVN
ncbi:hypothetical protein HKD37_11G030550 [Glycine soja]